MRTKRIIELSIILASTTIPAAEYQHRPTVTRAFDLIEQFPEAVDVGTPALFTAKAGVNVRALLDSGLIVRIFTLREGEVVPHPHHQDGDCDVYFPVVYALVESSTGKLQLETMPNLDESWLNLSNTRATVLPGHYFFVFERGAKSATKEDRFRLRSADARAYFRTGFRVVVRPRETITPRQIVARFERRLSNLAQVKEDNDRDPRATPCFRYEALPIKTAEHGKELDVGRLLMC